METEIEPSKELAYFSGVICGDGYVAKNSSIVEIKDDNKLFFEKVYIPVVKNLFNVTPKVIKENSCNNGYRCYMASKSVSEFLKMTNIISPKTFTVKTPDWIINGSNYFKLSFLRGLFDTDGYLDIRRNKGILNYPTIAFASRSCNLADEVRKIMRSSGLNAKLCIYNSKDKPMYMVRIYGFKEFEKYMKLIGFANPKILRKINKLLSSGLKRAVN